MDIDRMLLKAISQEKTIEFLRGEGEYMIETSQYSPEACITDVSKVLSKGIYKIYESDTRIKEIFEDCLIKMIDTSDFDIYMVCKYLLSQFFKEKNGIAPFILSKDLIVKELKDKLKERKGYISEGIKYPNGCTNTKAKTEIERFRNVFKEEYNVVI